MANRKFYEIAYGGKKMTDEQFAYLAENVLLGGVSHRYIRKVVEYDFNGSNAREDMRYAKKWLKDQGYEVIEKKSYDECSVKTENGDYEFTLSICDCVAI